MMKLFILIALLSFVLLLHAQNTSLMGVTTRKEVTIKGRTNGSEEKRTQRSPIFHPVRVFIDESDLLLEFHKLPCTVDVNIVDTQTGEVCYTETDVVIDTKTISLGGLSTGNYRLELTLNESTIVFCGDFRF